MRYFNTYGFIVLFGVFFLIILYKVIHVPVTTDEVPTVFFYSNFSFWQIMMYPDNIPNNHILNTLLAKYCIAIFGKEQWAIRLPSMLSFIGFAYGVFRILKLTIKPHSYFWLPAAMLFINPYWLDFFGLCRGYAISTTMVTLSIWLLIEGFRYKKTMFIWLGLCSSILASYANFSALIFWAATSIIAWLYFFFKDNKNLMNIIKPSLIIFFISLAYFALILTPILKMNSTDEFQYWTSNGFYKETIKSLIINWWYDSTFLSTINYNFWALLIFLVLIINIYYLLRIFNNNKSPNSHYYSTLITTALLLLSATINIIQTKILGTPNLNGRTALLFLPLASTSFACVLGLIPSFKQKSIERTIAIFISFIFLVNLSHRVSLKKVKEWYYDQNTLEVIDFLKEKRNQDQEQLSLKTSWFFHPSFYFYSDAKKTPWIDLQPYDYAIDITTSAEYYYIFAKDYELLEPRFKIAYKFSDDRWLLEQK
ncbi:hypothetical protein [Sunxiuqinia indica]|uniref:hypothetical protein n=1 Tax=Sunxiuqinia indica TaxID=2692584 RepID=UPI0013578EF2|nr:hypothetical protein [Sunxiuqinia indica]